MDEPLSAEVLHALAHPVRLAALLALEERERTPDELAEALGVPAPELLAQLHVLEVAGLTAVSPETRRLRVRSTGWAGVARRLQELQDASGRGGEDG